MSMPVDAIDERTAQAFAALAVGDTAILREAGELREELRADSGLDAKTFALVKIAALVAMDAPPASYLWQVQGALGSGAAPREILGVLTAVAPQAGLPRVVAAAPEIMVALGLELPMGVDQPADTSSPIP
jgi:4-carboxymuconolactone decarboxylase